MNQLRNEDDMISESYNWKENPSFVLYSILMAIPILMVFIFFNYYNLDFLVYTGWIIFACSIILIFLAGGEFRKRGGAPEGESIVKTTVLVDSGVYAMIRHPQYLGFMLIVFSLVLISQHWFSLISAVIGCALFYFDVRQEEQNSITKFGDKYKQYMQKVPGFNFLLGIILLVQQRKKMKQIEIS